MKNAQQVIDGLKDGEYYAGLVLPKDGQPGYHLVGLPGEFEEATWQQAMEWAQGLGGGLPNLRDLGLLRVNAREQFKDDWYWSSEEHASDSPYAWGQYFYVGYQNYGHKSYEGRARAIRRIFFEV